MSDIISLKSADKYPRSVIYDRGFRLLGTPLTFGRATPQDLLFVPSPDDPVSPRARRVIATSQTVAKLSRRIHLDALALETGHVFRLGRMDLRLLPTGLGPQEAMLEIRTNRHTLLYCKRRLSHQPLFGLEAEQPRCDLLIIDGQGPKKRTPSPKNTIKSLRQHLATLPTTKPVNLLVGSKSAAIQLFAPLHETFRICAVRSLYDAISRAGFDPASLSRLVRKQGAAKPGQITLHTNASFTKLNQSDPPAAYVGEGTHNPGINPSFPLGEEDGVTQMVKFAVSTGAGRIVLAPGRANLAAPLRKKGMDVALARIPTQLVLPL